jgi:hypothetical protein
MGKVISSVLTIKTYIFTLKLLSALARLRGRPGYLDCFVEGSNASVDAQLL